MTCTLSPRARADLVEIGDYIAHDNPGRAATFIAELRAHCVHLAEFPASAQRRPDIDPEIRIAPHAGYIICYETTDRGIHIVRIVSGRRFLPVLLDR